MRVLVATGPFTSLTCAQTGAAMARAWAQVGARLAVVPMGEAGKGFSRAWADLTDAEDGQWHDIQVFRGAAGLAVRTSIENPGRPHDAGSSEIIGVQLAAALAWAAHAGGPPDEVWLEVPGFTWADGGRGFLEELRRAHALSDDVRLHLVTTTEQAALHLTGLRGLTASTIHSAGLHPGELLAADQRLVDWCAELGDEALGTAPGAGAVGGLGAAVLSLGGDVVTGPAECARLSRLAESMGQCDLVVTGYDELEFGTKGGDLLPLVTSLAEQAARPVIALARTNWISARELRSMGIEQAFALATHPDERLDEAALTAAAAPAVAAWSW